MDGETDETSKNSPYGDARGRLPLRLPLYDSHDGSVRDAAVADVQLSECARRTLSEVLDPSIAHPETRRAVTSGRSTEGTAAATQTPTWCRARRSGAAGTSEWRRISSWHRLTWGTRRRGASGGLASSCTEPANWRPSAGCYLKPGVNWRETLIILRCI